MSQNALAAYVQALEALSPMPDDDTPQMTTDLIDRRAELVVAIGHELEHRFEAHAVGALVHSFGLRDGFESYWTTVHVLEDVGASAAVYALIRTATEDSAPGVRKWCCLLLGRRREKRDLPLFIARLGDAEERVVVQALTSIRMLAQTNPAPAAIPALAALVTDPRPAVAATAHDTLQAPRPSAAPPT